MQDDRRIVKSVNNRQKKVNLYKIRKYDNTSHP